MSRAQNVEPWKVATDDTLLRTGLLVRAGRKLRDGATTGTFTAGRPTDRSFTRGASARLTSAFPGYSPNFTSPPFPALFRFVPHHGGQMLASPHVCAC
jgi:hypothetical protein